MRVTKNTEPGVWYHVKDVFDIQELDTIMKYMPDTPNNVNGQRGKIGSSRSFVTRNSPQEICSIFEPYLYKKDYFTELTGVDCTQGQLRVELVCDNAGSHLTKHIDIPEKLITLQVYMGKGEPFWGTTIYKDENTQFYTIPFVSNTGWMTHQNGNLLHGVKENVIDDKRYSVLINYVFGDWRDTSQLY